MIHSSDHAFSELLLMILLMTLFDITGYMGQLYMRDHMGLFYIRDYITVLHRRLHGTLLQHRIH